MKKPLAELEVKELPCGALQVEGKNLNENVLFSLILSLIHNLSDLTGDSLASVTSKIIIALPIIKMEEI